jgi:hypothetical protein
MQKSVLSRCVICGFVASFFLGFVIPVFLNPQGKMNFFHYILELQHVGMDMRAMMAFCRSWLEGGSPYIEVWVINPYPPFATVFFSPLAFISIENAYVIMTSATFLSYLLSCTILVKKIVGEVKDIALIYLFLASGLFSYGLLFEIERGQFNLIAVTSALSAIALWQKDGPPHRRMLAYILLSLGIQLKVYPALFALCLTDNLRDWKKNALRIGTLGVVNFLAFFVLGIDTFKDFLHYLEHGARNPEKWIWVGAHSIKSFADVSNFRQEPFWAVLLLCFSVTCIIGFIKRWEGKNRFLLMAISCVTMLAPTISHDYKLSTFHPFVCILLVAAVNKVNPNQYLRIVEYIAVTLISLCYFLTNYSYQNKMVWGMADHYRNNMPLILTIFVSTTILMFAREYVKNRSRLSISAAADAEETRST